MAKNLKEAIEKNRIAAAELDQALRECLQVMKQRDEALVETVRGGRLRVVQGGRMRQHAKM